MAPPGFGSGDRSGGLIGSGVEVGEGEIASVVRVTFETDEPAFGAVAFGDAELDHSVTATASEDGLSFTADIIGLPAGTTWHVRPQAESTDGATWFGETIEVTVPEPPETLSFVSVEVEAPAPRWLLQGSPVGDPPGIVVTNEAGQGVWWWETDAPIMDAQLLADGSGIVSVTSEPDSVFRIHNLDGTLRTEVQIVGAHHSMVELPDGHFALIVGETREVDGEDVAGDTLVDVAPDGTVGETIWSAWDNFTPDPDKIDFITMTGALDWTHMNTVTYDEATDTFWVGLRGLRTVVEIDHASGATRWILGGEQNEFDFGDDEPFLVLHWPRRTDRGILLFDNGDSEERPWSRAVEFELDLEAHTATRVWSVDADEERFTGICGSVERLADGNTQITWGEEGVVEEVDADGEVVWQLQGPEGHTLGFGHALAAFGDL